MSEIEHELRMYDEGRCDEELTPEEWTAIWVDIHTLPEPVLDIEPLTTCDDDGIPF